MDNFAGDRLEVVETRECIGIPNEPCGKSFEITRGEKDFYESKNITLPKRCKACRQKNRNRKENQNGHNGRPERKY